MRAVQVTETGGPEVLRLVEVEAPRPGPGQVVVRVAAAGMNFIDTYQRSGTYPVALPAVLGLEGAGSVTDIGPDVRGRAIGDRVAWADAFGSYAEQVVLAADRTVRIPDGVETEVAAALMLQGMTAQYLSQSTYRLGRDDTVLVYAAAGGVGRLLVQLAKRRGARVLACTSTAAKAEQARAAGADATILYRDVDVVAAVRELTDGAGVDVVYDAVGRDTFDASLDCLKPRGLMVLHGAASGPVPPMDPQVLNRKGSLYLTRPTLATYIATSDELEWRAGALFDLVAAGQLDVQIHERYPLADAERAHRDLESGTTTGKLLLIP
jgi:NADPH:quinone reductase